MRRCDTYIHVPDLMLTIDLKVKCKGFLTCFRVRPETSVSFNIGLPYLAHGSITMRRCDTYIHVPVSILTFHLNVKFIGLMTLLCVQASVFLSFDIVILSLALECITMIRCVAYIHEICMTLTFDLQVNFIGFCHVFMSNL